MRRRASGSVVCNVFVAIFLWLMAGGAVEMPRQRKAHAGANCASDSFQMSRCQAGRRSPNSVKKTTSELPCQGGTPTQYRQRRLKERRQQRCDAPAGASRHVPSREEKSRQSQIKPHKNHKVHANTPRPNWHSAVSTPIQFAKTQKRKKQEKGVLTSMDVFPTEPSPTMTHCRKYSSELRRKRLPTTHFYGLHLRSCSTILTKRCTCFTLTMDQQRNSFF